ECHHDVGRTRQKVRRPQTHLLGLVMPPLHLRDEVATLPPAKLIEPVEQRGQPTPRGCGLADAHQHCNTTNAAWPLLRPRRHRPRCRAADERDELASSHWRPRRPWDHGPGRMTITQWALGARTRKAGWDFVIPVQEVPIPWTNWTLTKTSVRDENGSAIKILRL